MNLKVKRDTKTSGALNKLRSGLYLQFYTEVKINEKISIEKQLS